MARAFRAAGYPVGHFGKWHMGVGRNVDDAPLPAAYGYDESLVAFEGLGIRLLYDEEGRSGSSANLRQGALHLGKTACNASRIDARRFISLTKETAALRPVRAIC